MTSQAQHFLETHWPEEWPEYDDEGWAFYKSILKEWELEHEAAIQDRWIEFRDAHQINQAHAAIKDSEATT